MDQDPDAGDPARQDRAGSMPAGHGPATNPTSPAPSPEAATARTSAAERAANAPRPEPHWPDETANTTAPGAAWRTKASAPLAQPTATP